MEDVVHPDPAASAQSRGDVRGGDAAEVGRADGFKLRGASGHDYGAPESPWAMPAPTTVSQTRDGHPSGRHMIDGYRMMAAAARVSGGKYQKQMAEVYETAALCIENEAKRADRAEALLRQAQQAPPSPPREAVVPHAAQVAAKPSGTNQ